MTYNAIILFMKSMEYVANQNLFWGSMGFTVAIAIFVGAMLFDGNIEQSKKGMVAVGTYAFMLVWTTGVRILPNAIERDFVYNDGRALASIATIVYITLFWMIGVMIGVNIFKLKKYRE